MLNIVPVWGVTRPDLVFVSLRDRGITVLDTHRRAATTVLTSDGGGARGLVLGRCRVPTRITPHDLGLEYAVVQYASGARSLVRANDNILEAFP